MKEIHKKSTAWAYVLLFCFTTHSPIHAASVSPTGILPEGSFVNDFSIPGVVAFEILWLTNKPIQLTVRLETGERSKVSLRMVNTNATHVAWADFHVHLDDTLIGSEDNNPNDDPIWDTIYPVEVSPAASTSTFLYSPILDKPANRVDHFFNPFVLPANGNNPNGQLFIGAFNGRNLNDWSIDVSPLVDQSEFTLTLNPTIIPTPSAAWAGFIGFTAMWVIFRRRNTTP
ncbi:MAG: hypothetical protein ACYTGQ_00985 [Planctomycetota bacterium]|jgi:hypothetical protein